MSRIDDLIAEHCPDGVEFLAVEDLFDLRNGYTPAKSKSENWTDGTVPWFRMEDIRSNGRILDDSIQHVNQKAVKGGRLFPPDSIIVATSATIGEHALITVPHLSNQRFTSLATKTAYQGMLDIRFVYYYCFVLDDWCLRNTTTSSFASVDMSGFRRFRFPVPPLAVQHEIVRILDTFTELEAELKAELGARKRQFAHYRDNLIAGSTTARTSMSELGSFARGRRFTKADVAPSGIASIHYGEIYTDYGASAVEAIRKVRADMSAQLRYARTGDVIIACVGETVEDVGKAVAWLGSDDVAIHDDVFSFRSDMDPRFVVYAMQTPEFQSQKVSFVSRAKVKRLSGQSLAKISIPTPSLAEQRRIVDALGKFDDLVNDLNSGLPAEITARRKQYEYYRDRLLSFKELTA